MLDRAPVYVVYADQAVYAGITVCAPSALKTRPTQIKQ
jgi:hypothetical protein